MKSIITSIVVAMTLVFSTAAYADEPVECTTSDVVIGGVIGVTGAAVLGVVTVAMLPVGAVGGPVVGLAGALSAPFLTGSTLMSAGISTAIMGPIMGTAGTYVGCVAGDLMR